MTHPSLFVWQRGNWEAHSHELLVQLCCLYNHGMSSDNALLEVGGSQSLGTNERGIAIYAFPERVQAVYTSTHSTHSLVMPAH